MSGRIGPLGWLRVNGSLLVCLSPSAMKRDFALYFALYGHRLLRRFDRLPVKQTTSVKQTHLMTADVSVRDGFRQLHSSDS